MSRKGEKMFNIQTQYSILNTQSFGALYVVCTPIGNLEDMTLRSIRTLKEADFILCEDKRVTQKLLNRYEIKTKLISFHRHNERDEVKNIISSLKTGKNIALVSDAGSPLISDPGCDLISAAYKNGIKVISIPGASALISALSICPIKFTEFTFLGFLPDKASKRNDLISSLGKNYSVVILYIAPHDLKKYIKEIYDQYPTINIFHTRELTKIYEESWYGKIKDFLGLIEKRELKGEMVLVLDFQEIKSNKTRKSDNEIIGEMKNYISKGASLKEVSKLCAKEYDLSKKDLYNMYIKKPKGEIN